MADFIVGTFGGHNRLAFGAAAMCVAVYALLRRRASAAKMRNKRLPKSRQRATSIGLTRVMNAGVYNDDYDCIISLFAHFESAEVGGAPMDKDAVAKIFHPSLSKYRNFRCAPKFVGPVLPGKTLPEIEWVEPPKGSSFDFDYHFQQHDFSSNEEMEKWVNDKSNRLRELRVNSNGVRPWYDVHVMNVKGAKSPEGKTVSHALIRVHHCVGDGISLVQAFSGVMADKEGKSVDLSSVFQGGGSTKKKKPSLMAKIGNLCIAPFAALSFVKHCALFLYTSLSTPDTASAFHTPSEAVQVANAGAAKRVQCYLPSHSVDFIKKIKARVSEKVKKPVTINDMEYALFAGAVRRYINKVGGDANQVSMRSVTPCALPVKLEAGEDELVLGLRNYFAFLETVVPIAPRSALERVVKSNAVWNGVKTSMMIPAAFAMTKFGSLLPLSVQSDTGNKVFSRVSVVFSNVPGPSFPIYISGHKLTGAHMVFPNAPVQVGIFSCDGYIHQVLTMMQGGSAKNPVNVGKEEEVLSACFMEELEELAGSVGFSAAEVKAAVKAKYI